MNARAVTSIAGPTEKRAMRNRACGHFPFSAAGIEAAVAPANWKRHFPSSVRLVLVFFLGLSAALRAQNPKGSWSDLNGLRAGQGVEVIESSMKSHSGEFVAVTDDSRTLKEHGSTVSVRREDVVRVSTGSGPKRGEHAVIGLVVGAGIGAAIGAIAADRSGGSGWIVWKNEPGIGALVGIVIGAPIGAAVGAVLPAHTTLYRAVPAARPGAVPPALAPAARTSKVDGRTGPPKR